MAEGIKKIPTSNHTPSSKGDAKSRSQNRLQNRAQNCALNNGATAGSSTSGVPIHRYVLFFSIVALGVIADLWTKEWVFQWRGLPRGGVDNTWWLWEGYIGIQTSVNQGALFGMGKGLSGYFAAISVAAVLGVVYWLFVRREAKDILLTITLGCITAGILGNLYDRLGFWHPDLIDEHFSYGVRDWILFRYKQYTWPNFNLADSLLVCGAGLLCWRAFRPEKPADDQPDEKTRVTAAASGGGS